MERQLLLLGLLRGQDMHGYQLNEQLEAAAKSPVSLKKPTAYYILSRMEERGWIASHEEREGKRPAKRVYNVTSKGEQAFFEMLRESLGAYRSSEFPSAVALNFIDTLPPSEAASLLRQRRDIIARRFAELQVIPRAVLDTHLGMGYLHNHYQSELRWLDDVIERLESK